MDIPKISIIVPVYNVEQYISKCIHSILEQSYRNWELILVDDGSRDKSGQICDKFSKQDERIKVVHKENGGVSSARNIGIDNSNGDWITFVDADDWLDPDTLRIAMQFTNYDIVRFTGNYVYEESGNGNYFYQINDALLKDDLLKQVISRRTLMSVWGCVFKKDLFKSGIRFNTSLTNGEDWLVLVTLLYQASTVKLLNLPLYQYNCYNVNSCVANMSVKKISEALLALRFIRGLVDDKKYYSAICTATVSLVYASLRTDIKYNVFAENILNFKDIFYSYSSAKEKIYVCLLKLIYRK